MTQSSDRTLSFAIVGCGLIGKKRSAALAGVAGARLAYACDVDGARASALASGAPGCRAVADFREAIADKSLDAVVVSTVNSFLAPVSLAAAEAGKHVLVEKPGALNSAELRLVRAAAERTGAKVRVGYNHRFHPALLKAREITDSGVLGPLMFLRARYGHGGRKGYDREWRADPKLSGGGELIDQGVHLIDLAISYFGDFEKVEGHASTLFWDMKVDDNAFLSLRTRAGQTAWLHASCTEWKNLFSLEVYGRDGELAVDGLGGSYGTERLAYHRMLPEMGPPETTLWEFPGGDGSWAAEMNAFADDIRLGRRPAPGLPEAVRTLEIVEEIYGKSGYPLS
ncbi:MAG TPA: Gfo/Idh/MocA family oxidoreductase [Opitutaceae bacterium]